MRASHVRTAVTRAERCGDVDRQIHDSCFRIAEKAGALRFCASGHAAIYRPFDDRAEAARALAQRFQGPGLGDADR